MEGEYCKMPDREKVIKGLDEVWEYISKNVKDIASRKSRMMNIVADACNLLKEQETEIDEIADEYLDLGSEMAKQPEIVRCKDCVYAESFMESYRCYFDEENESGCKRSHDADFFCAYGERKD